MSCLTTGTMGYPDGHGTQQGRGSKDRTQRGLSGLLGVSEPSPASGLVQPLQEMLLTPGAVGTLHSRQAALSREVRSCHCQDIFTGCSQRSGIASLK